MTENLVENEVQTAVPAEKPAEERHGKFFYLYTAGIVFGLCAQIVLLIVYLFGAADFFGEGITPISSIEAIINVFSLRKAGLYRYLVKGALGVFYLVLFIPLIKSLVGRLAALGKSFRIKTDPIMRSNWLRSKEGFLSAFWLFAFFQLFTCLFARGAIGGGTVFVLCIFCAFCLFDGVVSALPKPQADVSSVLLSVCKSTVAAVLFCILYSLLPQSFGENVFDGLAMLFGGYLGFSDGGLHFFYALISNLILPILGCIMCVWMVIAMKSYFETVEKYRIGNLRAFLIFCAVVTVLLMLFRAGISYNNAKMFFSDGLFSDWFRSVRDFYLPFTLGIAGVFAADRICTQKKTVVPRGDGKQKTA